MAQIIIIWGEGLSVENTSTTNWPGGGVIVCLFVCFIDDFCERAQLTVGVPSSGLVVIEAIRKQAGPSWAL